MREITREMEIKITPSKDKAIQELEQENEKLRTRCEQSRDEGTGYMQQLEEENARLKLELEALSGDIPWNKLKDVSEVTKKLTEAKEILQTVLDKWKEERWILQSEEEIKQTENLMEQAENFLKE